MNQSLTIRHSRFTDIGPIASRMRDIDRIECEAVGSSPKQSLRTGFNISLHCWTACINDRPEAMFGLSVRSMLGGTGVPWFLGTDEVYRHGKALMTYGPYFIKIMRDSIAEMDNIVSSENVRAIRLLKKWGFSVSDQEFVLSGVNFRRFSYV